MDTPYVREYVEDREVTAWLLLDRSASMGFGPVDRQKSLVLAEVATTLAHLLTRGGNRVGAVLFDGDIATIPPGQGRNQVLRISQALLAPARRRPGQGHHRPVAAAAGRARAGPAPLAGRHRLRLHQRAGLGAAAGAADPRHDVVAIQVVDPREFELPAVGMIYVEDAETGEQIFVDTNDPVFRERLAAAAERAPGRPRRGRAPAGHRAPPGRDRRGPRPRAGPHLRAAQAEAPMTLRAGRWLLLALLAVPVLVVALPAPSCAAATERRAELAAQGLVAATGRRPDRWRHVAPVLLLAALALLLASLARPAATVAEPRREGTVILAFDVSTSMAAKDLAPDPARRRQGRGPDVRRASSRRSIRLGVVAFGDSGRDHPAADRRPRRRCSPPSTG